MKRPRLEGRGHDHVRLGQGDRAHDVGDLVDVGDVVGKVEPFRDREDADSGSGHRLVPQRSGMSIPRLHGGSRGNRTSRGAVLGMVP